MYGKVLNVKYHPWVVSTLGTLALAAQLFAADPIVGWNKFVTDQTSAIPMDPITETRVFAIMHIAIHDAVNAAEPRYLRYTYQETFWGASPEAAAAAAARDVLANLLPTRASFIEAAYQQALSAIPDGDPKTRGIRTGKAAAAAILELRRTDGADQVGPILVGKQPGEWRPTPPDFTPAFLTHWGRVTPFAMESGGQFRPPPPYEVTSANYTADFNEVKLIGSDKSTTRTAEQGTIARYWYENSGLNWNRITRVVAEPRGLNLWDSARLFALVNIAMADGFIGGFEAKYRFDFWRPVTAIREAENDGNPRTTADPNWLSFIGNPPVPDYPSTHSVLGGAAAEVLARFFGTDFITFDMTSGAPFPDITRHFFSFSEAAQENAASRVLAGIHFTTATREGIRQGERIGNYTFVKLLRPLPN